MLSNLLRRSGKSATKIAKLAVFSIFASFLKFKSATIFQLVQLLMGHYVLGIVVVFEKSDIAFAKGSYKGLHEQRYAV